jgi:hypothetical protein
MIRRTLLLAAGLWGAAFAVAQTTAEITGLVTDTSHAVVPGAVVTAMSTDRQTRRHTTTNAQGNYRLTSLEPGNYRVNVEGAGFRLSARTGLKLDVNQSLRLDFTLEVGQLSERIEVVAEASLLEANTAQLGTVVSEEKISDLPLNARNFTQLLTLTPGASPVSVAQNRNGGQTTPRIGILVFPAINGQTNRSNSFTLDGVYNTGHFLGTYTVAPNIDGLNQFKVQSHSDQAEFGGVTGGVINISSKSGTNELHGSLFEFLRNDKLDGRAFFTAAKPPHRQNQFGAAVGGPVIRNKTFFFASYEGYLQVNASSQLALVPTPAERTGDFRAASRRLFDPYTTRQNPANPNQRLRDPFPDNRIPASRLNRSIQEYVNTVVPLPIDTGVAGFNARNDDPQTFPSNAYSVRIDHYLSPKDSLWGRFTWSEQNTSSALSLKGARITNDIPAKNLGVGYTHTFGPNTVFNALFGFSSTRFMDAPVHTQRNFNAEGLFKGFPDDPRALVPGMSVPGYFSLSMRNRILGPQPGVQVRADLLHNFGRHSIKFGGETVRQSWTNTQITETLDFNTRQTADLNSLGATGNALASFFLGVMEGATLTDPSFSLRSAPSNFYVQDSWKVTKSLTLNFGLRWDMLPSIQFTKNFGSTWDYNTGKFLVGIKEPPACGQSPKPPCLIDPNLDFVKRYVVFTGSSKPYQDQWTLPGPRFGFAWQARPNTVIRGSLGLFYDLTAGTIQRTQNLSFNANWPFSAGRTLILNQNTVEATADQPFGSANPFLPTPTPPTSGTYVDPNIRNVYSEQWNVEIQRELVSNLALSAAYVGSHNLRLAIGGDYNTALFPGPGPVNDRKLWPHAPVTGWDRSAGQSKYHGLQVKLERRMAKGFSFLSSYTWSKSMDTAISGYGSSESISLQNPYDPNGSRSVSGFDVPHMFSTAVIYALPFGSGRSMLNRGVASRIFGNWQVNGIITLRSGQPYNPQMNVDIANIGAVNNATRVRPDLTGNPRLNNPRPEAWFDRTAFAAPRPFTFGSAGRNILRSDAVQNLDLSLFREDRLGERFRLQVRIESFNLLNHPTFGIPQTVFTNPQFGRVSGTESTARQVQLGLKLLF